MAAAFDDDDLTKVEFETSEDVDVMPTFDSMGLREDLLRGIYAYGNYQFLMSKPFSVYNLTYILS